MRDVHAAPLALEASLVFHSVAPDRLYVKRSCGITHWFIALPVNIDDHVQCYFDRLSWDSERSVSKIMHNNMHPSQI